MKLTDIFIERPVLATVLSLLILVVGLRALFDLPLREYPRIETTVITITTAYPGASADLVKGFITTPIQQAVASAEGIDYVSSKSTPGLSVISVNMRLGYDPNTALTEIMSKVAQVSNQLPAGSQQPVIQKGTGRGTALMYLAFYSTEMTPQQVTDYLTRVVQPKLQGIEGVAQAQILGGKTYAMRIWLEPDKLAAYGLTPQDVVAALQANNYLAAVGGTRGDFVQVDLNARTDLHTPAQFRELVVKRADGALIRLGQVARVELGAQSYDSNVSFNGLRATFIGIEPTPSANPLDVATGVRKAMPGIQAQLPSALKARIVYDSSTYISDAIREVIKTIGEALLIVVAVIFLFLGSLRAVLVPAITIPLSMIGAAAIMLWLGYSLNLLTLLAMVLAIGLVVDDAIIVVENIHRHMESGMRATQAAILGARELAGPIMAMSFTLIAVFAPIGLVGGLTGSLFSEFAFTLAAAVFISGIVALTLSPMMSARLFAGAQDKRGFAARLDHLFGWLQSAYQRRLGRTLDYRPVTYLMALVVLASIGLLYAGAKHELAPTEDQGILFMSANGPQDATPQYMEAYANQFYKIFSNFPDADRYFVVNGMGGVNNTIAGLAFKPWSERGTTIMSYMPRLQREVAGVAGLRTVVFPQPSLPGAGQGLPVQFVITTTADYRALDEVARALEQKAQASGLFAYVDNDLKIRRPRVDVVVDRAKAASLGLSMQDIGGALTSLLGGNYVQRFSIEGRSYEVIPQVADRLRANPDLLKSYYVRSADGTMVPLSAVVSLKGEVEPSALNQFQQLNAATIGAVMRPGQPISAGLDYLRNEAKRLMPADYGVSYAGESRQYVEEGNALLYTFFFSIVLIYLVLAALFESFRDPVTILVTVPMSICGALIFIYLGLASVNIYTQIGLITLIGLISKHGILIVRFANELQQAEGLDKRAAVERAAAIRLRPILMTTAAMVVGVVPLMLAGGPGAVSRFDLGLVIFTGMLIGTLFTLFVVPALYMLLARSHQADAGSPAHQASPA
ncbi:efflux RND transporter permease subunit [Acidihalobacter prosperus]|uniref:Acriflavine resistance protein B n=1 Tax=Acidihalobacter prosperus TaxID=160660 RepID=A0A1A6C1B1_9GAMM|nr:efflux RND transporter permease subunit [Acidihalobacter prosperus]OBS08335.1 acriflavine resistance protein B [Acidihalobacter prosperus]